MTKNRPVFLDLTKYHFPIAAVMSVGHRASGVFMIFLVPVLVYLLDLSLRSPQGYAEVQSILSSGLVKLMLFVALWALIHHLLAGFRFLLIDFNIGVEKESSRITATLVMVAAPLIALIIGLML